MTAKGIVVLVMTLTLLASLRAVKGSEPRILTATVLSSDEAAGAQKTHRIQAQLGARLFFDRTLSQDSSISCATCHSPYRAFTENAALSHGVGIRARKRNTPSLVNVAIDRKTFDWDVRAGSLQEQLTGVFSKEGDMGIELSEALARIDADLNYRREFLRAFGAVPNARSLFKALSTFQQTLIGRSRFDRYYLDGDDSALTIQEKRGWIVFQRDNLGCKGCHLPLPDRQSKIIRFEDDRFHNLGVGYKLGRLNDFGRFSITQRNGDWGAFRTPSLSNVALTGPYMHDGSIKTLEAVVDFYVNGGIANENRDPVIHRRHLSNGDRADLISFLRALTTEWVLDSAEVRRRCFGLTEP